MVDIQLKMSRDGMTANDLLVWIVNVFDLTFSEWDRQIDRMELGVDFPVGFSDSSYILVARNKAIEEEGSSSFHLFSFAEPFDGGVWLSILGAIIFTGLVYRLVSITYTADQVTIPGKLFSTNKLMLTFLSTPDTNNNI